MKNTLHIVDTVLTSDGSKELYKTAQENQQVFDANDCHLVQKAMQGTTTYGTAAGVSARLGRQVAGKSGTANDEKAASFVGYTPQLLNVWAIWNPAEDGSAQEVPPFAGYGVSSTGYPSHLFEEFMSLALQNQEVLTFTEPTDNGKIGGPDARGAPVRRKPNTAKPGDAEGRGEHRADHARSYANSDQNSAGNGDGGNSGTGGTVSNGSNSGDGSGDNSGDGGNSGNSSGDNSGDDQSNGAQ